MGAHPTLLFTGASGLVGRSLHHAAFTKWRCVLAVHRRSAPAPLRRGDRVVKVDLAQPGAAERLVAASEPQAVLHAAAMASLADCEADPARARRLNVEVTAELARAAAAAGAYFVLLSTDQVFDGDRAADGGGYREEEEARPLTEYGRTKVAAEQAVLGLAPRGEGLVVRAALVLAPSEDGRSGALDMVRGSASSAGGANAGGVRLFVDEWRTPVSVLDLARVLDEALHRRASGILHVAGPERVSRFELGQRIAAAFPPALGEPAPNLVQARQSESGSRRPRDVSLATERLEREQWPRPARLDDALAELRALAVTLRRA